MPTHLPGRYPSATPSTSELGKMPFTEINGKTVFYSWKPASRAGLTLFFLHGLGGAHSFWSPVIPGLVEAGFSCLAIDVPGAFCSRSIVNHEESGFSHPSSFFSSPGDSNPLCSSCSIGS